jgi:prepilin-type N-terminal cleavage/methylation domain-containing protein
MTKNNQKGFTLVELMIATAVFTVVLLVATTGIIRIGNIYYKGIITAQTQNSTRNIGNDLATSLQFASYDVSVPALAPGASPKFYCLGNTIYVYYINSQYKKGNEFSSGLYSADLAPNPVCALASATTKCSGAVLLNCYNDRRQLLGENMRVMVFNIAPVNGSSTVYSINLRTIYGDTDLLTSTDNAGNPLPPASLPPNDQVTCKTGVAGSSFCAVAQLDTVVKKRLNKT